MGLVANNPVTWRVRSTARAPTKGTRFMQLCDAFDVPVLTMMDCPGIMVGPDHEREALVRHCARMFNVGANLTTPMFGVVVRKAYGLGVQAMCGASSLVPFFTVAWPTAEFAGMNIDGGVKLSSRRELMAIEDPEERKAAYDRKVARPTKAPRGQLRRQRLRHRRHHRSRRHPCLAGARAEEHSADAGAHRKEAPYVDTW